MNGILFIKTSSLGDVVHQMPAVTDAHRHYPDVRLTWVVEEAFAPLARLHPAIDKVISVSTRRWRSQLLSAQTWSEVSAFKAKLKSVHAEKVIDTQGLIRSALIARTASGERHGYDAASIKEPVASWFYDVKHTVAREQHAVARGAGHDHPVAQVLAERVGGRRREADREVCRARAGDVRGPRGARGLGGRQQAVAAGRPVGAALGVRVGEVGQAEGRQAEVGVAVEVGVEGLEAGVDLLADAGEPVAADSGNAGW